MQPFKYTYTHVNKEKPKFQSEETVFSLLNMPHVRPE